MHVVVVLDSGSFGGAETYIAHLAAHLPGGHRCTVVAAEPVPERLADALSGRAELVRVPPVGRRWHRLPALRRLLVTLQPDVVHVNLIDPAANRVLIAAALTTGVPSVATAHMTGATGCEVSRLLLGALYRRLPAVIAVSREIAEILVDELAVQPGKIHIIDNGVPPAAAAAAARGSVPFRIGAVGRLTQQKGFDVLIAAVRRLQGAGRRFEVLIAGEGRDHEALATAAAELPVELLGFVDDVPGFLATLDVFCLPSRAEGLPLALLEALAAGAPSVATSVGAIPDAVGDAALLVRPGDVDALAAALRQLIADPALRNQLAVRGRDLAARRFSAHRMAEQTAAIWASTSGRRA